MQISLPVNNFGGQNLNVYHFIVSIFFEFSLKVNVVAF